MGVQQTVHELGPSVAPSAEEVRTCSVHSAGGPAPLADEAQVLGHRRCLRDARPHAQDLQLHVLLGARDVLVVDLAGGEQLHHLRPHAPHMFETQCC
jgi:hypothetical protein